MYRMENCQKDKMAAIVAEDNFKCNFLNKNIS